MPPDNTSPFTVPTRQDAVVLLEEPKTETKKSRLLAPAESVVLGVREIRGYAAILFWAVADGAAPFSLQVRQAATQDGTFVLTNVIPSGVVDTRSVINVRLNLNAPFIRVTQVNGGVVQTLNQVRVVGLPIS
jgi:hypothetical protein